MSEYVWTDLRGHAVELFHDTPSASLEQRVLDVFREHPALVSEAIEHVGRRFATGQVRSPWAVLAKHVEEALRPLGAVTVTDTKDREKAIRRAEQWMRAAGLHYDREGGVLEELFGTLGRLRGFDSPELRERMLELGRQERPRGEQVDREELERADAWNATAGVLWRKRAGTLREKLEAAASPQPPDPELHGDDLVLEPTISAQSASTKEAQ